LNYRIQDQKYYLYWI